MKDSIGRENRKLENRPCQKCGKEFRPLRSASKYCSRPCLWACNGGHNKKKETWWTNQKGYIEGRIWLPNGVQVRVKKHRFVVEGVLGRPLKDWEDVHHIDGNKSNNKPSNLEVISHGDHSRITNSQREYKRGYKLNLSSAERRNRSLRAIAMQLSSLGNGGRP